jgi:hypothetical protein
LRGSLSKASRSRSLCESFTDADGFGGSSLPIKPAISGDIVRRQREDKTDVYYTTPFPEGEIGLNFVLVSSLPLIQLCFLYFSSSSGWVCERCMQTGGP